MSPASWVPVPAGSDFPLQNLPYGIFSAGEGRRRVGVAIGEHVLDLAAVAERGLLDDVAPRTTFSAPVLNPLLALGRSAWVALRARLTELLGDDHDELGGTLHAAADVTLHLPVHVGDYVDFYSSLEHATNLGRIFRPDAEPLLPNWRHLPVGYHGRAGTVVVSGTPVRRPCGQRKPPDLDTPVFGPSTMLDIELEVGFVTGGPANALGEPIPVEQAGEHIFGLVLVNDWSARDLQAWEYQPLGPFLGKSFATSISPWVVPLDALAPYRVAGPVQEPEVLPYLRAAGDWNLDLDLEVLLQSEAMAEPDVISRTSFRHMYWNMAQQLAHATVNGATAAPGDLFASGTVSGPEPGARGSLIELTWRGRDPLQLSDGSRRAFLDDGDTVTLRGWCGGDGRPRVGFGEVRGTVLPAVASNGSRP